jgi:acetyl-CoA carboxylase carboxyltransferase component
MSSKPTITGNSIKPLVEKTEQYLEKIYEGGGKKAIAKQKERNKLTARERIDYLIDKDFDFIEIGAFAGFEMY